MKLFFKKIFSHRFGLAALMTMVLVGISFSTRTALLIASAQSQAKVYVHRDYMPRNLMIATDPEDTTPGILDFQDAVEGPIGYDVISLLRDGFISWDEERVLDWAIR